MKVPMIVTLASLLLSCFTVAGYAGERLEQSRNIADSEVSGKTHTVLEQKPTTMYLNWAIHLSRYERPAQFPKVVFVPHTFLVESACYGVECNVLGWYNDTGVVYIDERFLNDDSLFSSSLIVHEMIHFLQHQSGEYTPSCLDVAAREKEAYWVQQEYHIANGTFAQMRPHHYNCDVLTVKN